MLILARNEGESIIMSDGDYVIEIKVHSIRNSQQVRLGIDAPRHIEIHRNEILESDNNE